MNTKQITTISTSPSFTPQLRDFIPFALKLREIYRKCRKIQANWHLLYFEGEEKFLKFVDQENLDRYFPLPVDYRQLKTTLQSSYQQAEGFRKNGVDDWTVERKLINLTFLYLGVNFPE